MRAIDRWLCIYFLPLLPGLFRSLKSLRFQSSIPAKAAFTLRAFFISSALTNGYSPYSRKLGH